MAKLKRMVAPRTWPIERKNKKFTISPSPGPHAKKECLPLGIILRDMLGYAKNLRETKKILKSGAVKVDGKIIKSHNFPVGLMDVITLVRPDGSDESFRAVPKKEGLRVVSIGKEETNIKPLKVIGKRFVRGNKMQISLHDGKNIIGSRDVSTGDVILYEIDRKASGGIIKMKKGALAVITRGRNTGAVGRIDKIIITMNPKPNQVVIAISNEKLVIPKDYVFVLGDEKLSIKLGEE
jgi:small subunit ribosomal protein S4e